MQGIDSSLTLLAFARPEHMSSPFPGKFEALNRNLTGNIHEDSEISLLQPTYQPDKENIATQAFLLLRQSQTENANGGILVAIFAVGSIGDPVRSQDGVTMQISRLVAWSDNQRSALFKLLEVILKLESYYENSIILRYTERLGGEGVSPLVSASVTCLDLVAKIFAFGASCMDQRLFNAACNGEMEELLVTLFCETIFQVFLSQGGKTLPTYVVVNGRVHIIDELLTTCLDSPESITYSKGTAIHFDVRGFKVVLKCLPMWFEHIGMVKMIHWDDIISLCYAIY